MAFSLNGTDVSAFLTEPGESIVEIGGIRRAANGRARKIRRAAKRTWDLSFEKITNAQRSTIQTIALLTSTFTLVDQHGNSYTVMVEPGSHKVSVPIKSPTTTPTAPDLYYTVSLKIIEQ